MKLSRLLENIDVIRLTGPADGGVSGLAYDSRECRENFLFIALPGFRQDGHDFIPDAVARGARYIVCEKKPAVPPGVTTILVEDVRHVPGILGKVFYGDPTSALTLIGITGTNGKTTVTYLLESILREAGHSVGVIGTVNYRYGTTLLPAPYTTPQSIDLQKILREMADAGVTHVVMEVSSHAIDLGRIDDCVFDAGLFTNLSQDHLDYHHDMESYYEAKKRFFTEILGAGKMIVNADDPWGKRLIADTGKKVFTYGFAGDADAAVLRFRLSIDGTEADMSAGKELWRVRSPLIGAFNLYNMIASAAAAAVLDIPGESIRRGIEAVRTIPGRIERVSGPDDPVVLVDYAHTEDALRKVLETLREFRLRRIITVFGCGGDRDRSKRPLMGRAAVELSDISIVTSDNPRREDPLVIIEDIERGIMEDRQVRRCDPGMLGDVSGGRAYTVIPDRKTAIATAVMLAGPEDIVLIAGKGHEDYQIIGERKTFFDDRIIAREYLAERPRKGG